MKLVLTNVSDDMARSAIATVELPVGSIVQLKGLAPGTTLAVKEGVALDGEIFEAAKTKDDEELANMMQFYDYIEVQPISAMSHLLQMESSGFRNELELQNHIKRIIRVAKEAGKLVVATGDVHNLTSEDRIYREIIVRQKANGKLHPLNRQGIDVPNMRFMTTQEMLDAFSFLDKDLAYEIVVENKLNKIKSPISGIIKGTTFLNIYKFIFI